MNKLTLRISDIPSSVTADLLGKLLQCLTVATGNIVGSAKRPRIDNICALSLAPSPSSTDSGRYKVATVTFREIPTDLKPCISHPRWMKIALGDGEARFSVIADSHFEGFTPLSSPSNPTVDIIALTGLGGHAFGSWRSRKGPEMWLRDFIPGDLEHAGHHARVLTYGYDTVLSDSLSNASIGDISKQFLELLKGTRLAPEERNRPIIFIGHSFGGLVIKMALREAEYRNDDMGNRILRSCHAILFFGVPHKGLGDSSLTPMVKGQQNSRLVEDLCGRSQFLDLLDKEFCRYFTSQEAKIVCYYELRSTPTVEFNKDTGQWQRTGTPKHMVTSESAVHPLAGAVIALDADHQTMVKYGNGSEANYKTVKQSILELVSCTPHHNGSFPVKRIGEPAGEQMECLRSLVPADNDPSVRLPSRAKAHPGTCTWLLNENAFKDWRSVNNAQKLLWISGNPGTGKTVSMHFLLDQLGETSPTVCFFCDDKDEAQRTAVAILRSIIHQLLRWNTTFFRHIMHEFEQFRQGESKGWSFDTLWRIFRDIACDPVAESVYCLIDALDECQDDSGVGWSRSELLERIIGLYSDGLRCGVRLIISSRPYHDLKSSLGVFPTIPIHEGTNGSDISDYIKQKLQQSFKAGISDEVKQEVADFLEKEARGMFLWVALVIKDLSRDFTDASIRNRYKTLPRDLYGYYDNTLAKIPPDDHNRAKEMLMWIVYAARPMTLDELNIALATSTCTSESQTPPARVQDIQPYKSHDLRHELLERCGLLVEVGGDWQLEPEQGSDVEPDGDATVRLIHQSVKDFLTQSDAVGRSVHHRSFYTPLAQAHSLLAQSCLVFISFELFTKAVTSWCGDITLPLDLRILTEYCGIHWVHHLQQAGSLLPITKKCLLSFYTSHSENFRLLFRYLDEELYIFKEIPLMHLMSRLGIIPVVSFLLESGVNLEVYDYYECTALLWARAGGQWEMVKYLLNHGADIKAAGKSGHGVLRVELNMVTPDMVRYLVENGADVSLCDEHGFTPLIEFLIYGSQEAAFALIESVVDKEELLTTTLYRLYRAAPCSETRSLKPLSAILHLIHQCEDVNWEDDSGHTPLHYAYKVEMCEALVEKGANVNTTNSNGDTPLHYARDAQIARFLVRNGADVHRRNYEGGTPLDTIYDTETIGFLVHMEELNFPGDYPGQKGSEGNTILHSAAKRSDADMVESLLTRGAKLNSRNSSGDTALMLAVRTGNTKIVRVLVESGGDTNVPSGDGESPLHVAVKQDNREMVELLLEYRSDPNFKDSGGVTPLENAAWIGNQNVLRVLHNRAID